MDMGISLNWPPRSGIVLDRKDDYKQWETQILAYFSNRLAEGLLTGTWRRPFVPTWNASSEQKRECLIWEAYDSKACSILRESLGEFATKLVLDCTSAYAIWQELKRFPWGVATSEQLLHALLQCKLSQCQGVNAFARRLRILNDDLKKIGQACALSEALLIQIFKTGLGSDFSNFLDDFCQKYSTFSSQGQTSVDLEFIAGEASEYAAKKGWTALPLSRSTSPEPEVTYEPYIPKVRINRVGRSACGYCGKEGHGDVNRPCHTRIGKYGITRVKKRFPIKRMSGAQSRKRQRMKAAMESVEFEF